MASFADDDFYDPHEEDYEEEDDGMSPEDKVAMATGTEEVRKALGADASKVTVAQIQEALWHYYYDVEKSVAYLQKTFVAPTPKPTPKKATEGKFFARFPTSSSMAFGSAAGADLEGCRPRSRHNGLGRLQSPVKPILETPGLPIDAHFFDMPWLQTPGHRQTTFIAPWAPPGGLLGGSEGAPKMSKLQALAAARKKKTEQKKEQEKELQAEKGMKDLSISSPKPIEKTKQAAPAASSTPPPMGRASQSTGELSSNSNHPASAHLDHSMDDVESQVNMASHRPAPSAFAQTLIGSAPGGSQKHTQDVFAMAYASSSSYLASAFSEPSPDDIVLAAQAKGSNFARAK